MMDYHKLVGDSDIKLPPGVTFPPMVQHIEKESLILPEWTSENNNKRSANEPADNRTWNQDSGYNPTISTQSPNDFQPETSTRPLSADVMPSDKSASQNPISVVRNAELFSEKPTTPHNQFQPYRAKPVLRSSRGKLLHMVRDAKHKSWLKYRTHQEKMFQLERIGSKALNIQPQRPNLITILPMYDNINFNSYCQERGSCSPGSPISWFSRTNRPTVSHTKKIEIATGESPPPKLIDGKYWMDTVGGESIMINNVRVEAPGENPEIKNKSHVYTPDKYSISAFTIHRQQTTRSHKIAAKLGPLWRRQKMEPEETLFKNKQSVNVNWLQYWDVKTHTFRKSNFGIYHLPDFEETKSKETSSTPEKLTTEPAKPLEALKEKKKRVREYKRRVKKPRLFVPSFGPTEYQRIAGQRRILPNSITQAFPTAKRTPSLGDLSVLHTAHVDVLGQVNMAPILPNQTGLSEVAALAGSHAAAMTTSTAVALIPNQSSYTTDSGIRGQIQSKMYPYCTTNAAGFLEHSYGIRQTPVSESAHHHAQSVMGQQINSLNPSMVCQGCSDQPTGAGGYTAVNQALAGMSNRTFSHHQPALSNNTGAVPWQPVNTQIPVPIPPPGHYVPLYTNNYTEEFNQHYQRFS